MHRWHYIRSHHIFDFILFDYYTTIAHNMQHLHSDRHYEPSEYSWHNRLSAVGNVIFCLYVYIHAQNVQLKNNIIERIMLMQRRTIYGAMAWLSCLLTLLLLLLLLSYFHCLTFPWFGLKWFFKWKRTCTPKAKRTVKEIIWLKYFCAVLISIKWCISCDGVDASVCVCARDLVPKWQT